MGSQEKKSKNSQKTTKYRLSVIFFVENEKGV